MATFNIVQNDDPSQLLSALLGSDPNTSKGLSNFNLQLVGDGRAFGTFTDDPFGLGAAVALSTGQVRDLAGVNTSGTDLITDLGLPGLEGDSIFAILSFDADLTQADRIYFQYVFGSEEFVEFAGSGFNDTFELSVNGTNYARLSNRDTVSINNLVISPSGPFNADYIDNPIGTGAASGETKLDGYTKPLILTAPLKQGNNTLVINLADVGDGIYDSGVFLKAGTLGSVCPAGVDCTPFEIDDGDLTPPDPNDPNDPNNPNNPNNGGINLDVDASGAAIFARDGLLVSAYLFFDRVDRTDYSVLDKFVLDPAATRKTGNEIANFIKNAGGTSILDADGSGTTTFARDALLISAFLFFNRVDRTDFSVLDKFIFDSAATRKTGNEIADYLKGLLPSTLAASLAVEDRDLAAASDDLIGTSGNDTLTGDSGDSVLVGGAGDDLLTGGLGADTFKFTADSGNDTIADFSASEDAIAFDATLGFSCSCEIFAALTTTSIGDDRFSAELDLGANGKISIVGNGILIESNFTLI
jgi:Ca2+-binding RTX toxin-like protein